MSSNALVDRQGASAGTGQKLYARARQIIPGGTQLLSKRPEMFLPEQWPVYYERAKGAEVWDLDGKRYVDASIGGVGTAILGYADPEVEQAVIGAVRAGSMCTLNCPEEVELAELLLELHPWANMVRYGRGGGEIMAMAVRIARASTGRDKIAFCGYHGWHDWYLSTNLAHDNALAPHLLAGLEPAGVPAGLAGTMLPFKYNQIDELRAIVGQHGPELAAIVIEPCRSAGPAPGFLEEVRAIASKSGAVLVFDEVTSAWRSSTGGIHMDYGVTPDLAAFAKAMANGYPMAAVIGIRAVMDAAQRTFVSSTFWTEKIGPTAALATIRKHRRENVGRYITDLGLHVRHEWERLAKGAGLPITTSGLPAIGGFAFSHEAPNVLATLFTQEMLQRGFLAGPQFVATFAHEAAHVERYLAAVEEVFALIANAVKRGDAEKLLKGPVKHSGFQRLN